MVVSDPVDARLLALLAELGRAAVHEVAARMGMDPREVAWRLVSLSGSGLPLVVGVECDQNGIRAALSAPAYGPPQGNPYGTPSGPYQVPGTPSGPYPVPGSPSVAHPVYGTPSGAYPPPGPASPPGPHPVYGTPSGRYPGPPQHHGGQAGPSHYPGPVQQPGPPSAPFPGQQPGPPSAPFPAQPAPPHADPAISTWGPPQSASWARGDQPPQRPAGPPQEQPTVRTTRPEPQPPTRTGTVGTSLEIDGLEGERLAIQLVEVVDPADFLFTAAGYRLQEGERSVVVHTELTNRGGVPFSSLPDLYLVLVTPDGRTISKAPVSLSSRPPHRIGVAPGETAGGHTVYVLPEDIEVRSVRWSPRPDDEKRTLTWTVDQ